MHHTISTKHICKTSYPEIDLDIFSICTAGLPLTVKNQPKQSSGADGGGKQLIYVYLVLKLCVPCFVNFLAKTEG
jgi:hypothetical protein